MIHVVSGPDHLAAVTPLVIETKKRAWNIGLSWSLGHILGMLLIGVLFLLFKDYIPLEKVSNYSEQLVGVVLIGIGFWSFYGIFKTKKEHKHPHIHVDEKPYIHIHKHEHNHSSETHQHTHKTKISQNTYSSFGIGFLHGLAGIAHFILLLPVLGFETKFEGTLYVIGFGIGTILAMISYTLILSEIASYTKQHNDVFFKGVRLAGGIFAIVIGVYWLFANAS
jgi:ABC-type nickel/cobalt efflux system permease component RcnA